MLRLRELRKENDKTQVELATVIGVSRQVYANYENGINEPSIEILIALANYFECTLDYLTGRADDFGNVTIANAGSQLPAEAQELVDIYIALEEEYQAQILQYARYFADRRGIKTRKT